MVRLVKGSLAVAVVGLALSLSGCGENSGETWSTVASTLESAAGIATDYYNARSGISPTSSYGSGSSSSGPNSCRWAGDGECDEPNICDVGTDSSDCRGGGRSSSSGGSNSCRWAGDGECDEPNICDVGTDSADCRGGGRSSSGGGDSCRWAGDGECDEPNICDVGTDSTDCRG